MLEDRENDYRFKPRTKRANVGSFYMGLGVGVPITMDKINIMSLDFANKDQSVITNSLGSQYEHPNSYIIKPKVTAQAAITVGYLTPSRNWRHDITVSISNSTTKLQPIPSEDITLLNILEPEKGRFLEPEIKITQYIALYDFLWQQNAKQSRIEFFLGPTIGANIISAKMQEDKARSTTSGTSGEQQTDQSLPLELDSTVPSAIKTGANVVPVYGGTVGLIYTPLPAFAIQLKARYLNMTLPKKFSGTSNNIDTFSLEFSILFKL